MHMDGTATESWLTALLEYAVYCSAYRLVDGKTAHPIDLVIIAKVL